MAWGFEKVAKLRGTAHAITDLKTVWIISSILRRLNEPQKLELLLFAGYLLLFAWLVTKVPFFKKSGLTTAQLLIFFLVKVMAGIFYGWVGVYYGDMARMVDTWYYHYQSVAESKLLLSQPAAFFTGFFRSDYYSGYSGFLGAEGSWWNNLDVYFILKLMGIFNAASLGHYYINVIFYSFVTLLGPIALYRVYSDYYRGKAAAVLLALLCIPSFIYWTSGLHKEGLIFNCIAVIIYAFYFGLRKNAFSAKKIVAVILSFLLLLVLRNYIVLLIVPALIAWVASARLQTKPFLIFGAVYLFFIILFFAAPYISGKLDFPGAVVEKQRQFSALHGTSEVPMPTLKPTATSFLANAPHALSLSIMRPYFSDIRHLLSMAAAVEMAGLLLLFLVYLIPNRKVLHTSSSSLFCLFFAFSVLMIIGYTVNFLGAIVRYRSIVLPLLFAPVIIQIPWNHLARYITNIKNKNNVEDL